MRYTEAAPLASAPQHHSNHRDHHSHHSGGQQQQAHPRAAASSTTGTGPGSAATVVGASPAITNNSAAPSVMSGDLSEQYIFSPGAVVKAVTCHQETITGEVLSFEYDSRLLILKSPADNGNAKSSNVTCLNLSFCSKVEIIQEAAVERIAADAENTKLPDIDTQKLEERLINAVEERRLFVEAFKNGAGLEGVALYSRLYKTVPPGFGVSWDADSIIIGKNYKIVPPYSCRNITPINGKGDSSGQEFAENFVKKFWVDQKKDPYTLEPVNDGTAPVVAASPVVAPAKVSSASATQPKLAAPAQTSAPVVPTLAPAPAAPVNAPASKGGAPKGGPAGDRGGNQHQQQQSTVNRKSPPHASNAQPAKHQQQQQQRTAHVTNSSNHHDGGAPPPPSGGGRGSGEQPRRTGPISYASLASHAGTAAAAMAAEPEKKANHGPQPAVARG